MPESVSVPAPDFLSPVMPRKVDAMVADPLMIVVLGMGLDGAALGVVLSRCVMFVMAFHFAAGRYDLLNTVLSGGMDRYWRWRAIRTLGLHGGSRVLDVCTGTADITDTRLYERLSVQNPELVED